MTSPSGGALLLTSLLGLSVVSSSARADEIDVCASAATEGQRLQRSGKLHDARDRFAVCTRPICPEEVKALCVDRLATLGRIMPTVILRARDAGGHEMAAVRVSMDGVLLTEQLDGRPVEVDPGAHMFRFEHGGEAALEQALVLVEADKERSVSVTFEKPQDLPAVHRSPSALAYVLGGVGIVSLGAFVALTVRGQNKVNECDPGKCSSSTVDGLNLERDAAFGALALGVAAGGAATWLFVSRPTVPVHLHTALMPRGATLAVDGAF